MKVAKFGGSSLANATQFKKVSDIIQSDEERKDGNGTIFLSYEPRRPKGYSVLSFALIAIGPGPFFALDTHFITSIVTAGAVRPHIPPSFFIDLFCGGNRAENGRNSRN